MALPVYLTHGAETAFLHAATDSGLAPLITRIAIGNCDAVVARNFLRVAAQLERLHLVREALDGAAAFIQDRLPALRTVVCEWRATPPPLLASVELVQRLLQRAPSRSNVSLRLPHWLSEEDVALLVALVPK